MIKNIILKIEIILLFIIISIEILWIYLKMRYKKGEINYNNPDNWGHC